MAKINAKNIAVLTVSTTILSSAVGLIGGYILAQLGFKYHFAPKFSIALSWLFFHAPLTFAAIDSLRRELGLKPPIEIKKHLGRRIPLNVNNENRNIFMSTMPMAGQVTEANSFNIIIDENDYTISLSELEHFIRVAWARQRNGQNGLSRTYWTKKRRPRLKTLEYNIRMCILSSINGLILDRAKGRSGRLSVSPLLAIEALQK